MTTELDEGAGKVSKILPTAPVIKVRDTTGGVGRVVDLAFDDQRKKTGSDLHRTFQKVGTALVNRRNQKRDPNNPNNPYSSTGSKDANIGVIRQTGIHSQQGIRNLAIKNAADAKRTARDIKKKEREQARNQKKLMKEDIVMTENIKSMINHITSGDRSAAEQSFNKIISDKVSSALENLKVDIADQSFNTPVKEG